MEKGRKKLFIPKNSGLNSYVRDMLPEIGAETESQLEILIARGEDIPQRVFECVSRGESAYGLTGDDLYDEFAMGNDTDLIQVINTYDWFDEKAEYKRPALSLMSQSGSYETLPKQTKVAVNKKYQRESERFLSERFGERDIAYATTAYTGGTEETVSDGTNDCCIEVVYGGGTRRENNLKVIEVVRFSDIALIGPKTPKNVWEAEYQRLQRRKENPTGSYTSTLLQDENEIVKKCGQEGAEFIQAYAKNQGIVDEALDVFYATMVALVSKGIKWQQMESGLQQRWKT